MSKNNKPDYPYLTTTKTGYVLSSAHVKNGMAAEISLALYSEKDRTGKSIAAIVCDSILERCGENEARRRIEFALAQLDAWSLSSRASIVRDMRMILTGCEMSTTTVFTGKKSQEYTERYGDDAD